MTFWYSLLFVLFVSCTHSSKNDPDSVRIFPFTKLPSSFLETKKSFLIPNKIRVPQEILNTAYVVRNRAEVREGPGVQFRLQSRLLPHRARVLALQRVGVWQKVLVLDSGQRGWVHSQTLAKIQDGSELVELASKHLPMVFAITAIDKAFDYRSLKPLPVAIPKGAGFLCLGWRKKKALVYLSKTNSLMWLDRGDAQ